MPEEVQNIIDEATFDFAMGENETAVQKLRDATARFPTSFEAWHALAEVCFNMRAFDDALAAAEQAHALRPDDVFINTSLSRIWMEKGDKPRAEHFGAQARIMGWKDQLKSPQPPDTGIG